ncbi:MAG: efflux RND transporter periplasmic adaptor subunit [Candidatus Zixiibacteriota bacterium]|nr:MAG: efflux RND transporter periplasmic adaptor subunit [candidate division Zixibacteria bacterium]
MDKELSQNEIRKIKLRKAAYFLLPVGLIIIGVLAFRSIINPSVKRSSILTAFAEVGSIEGTISASGIIIPEHEQVLACPVLSRVEEIYFRVGESVKSGGSILKLNTESLQNDYDKLLNELELKKNNKSQLNLKLEKLRIDLQAQYDIKELQAKSIETEVEQKRHLHSIGAGTKLDLEQAELKLEIARRELAQLKNQIENQQASLAADLKELDLQINIQNSKIKELERQMDLARARADRNGVITWIKDDIGSSVNTGDMIAKIADLNSFKAEAEISDFHIDKLNIGGPAKIRINQNELTGRISGIMPTIQNGVVTFTVELDDKTNQSLRSNLRVDVDVVTSIINNIIRAKNGPYINGPGLQEIFVIEGNKAFKRKVKIGATNFYYIEIQNGVKEGEEVIISNMEDYIHRDEIKIK